MRQQWVSMQFDSPSESPDVDLFLRRLTAMIRLLESVDQRHHTGRQARYV